MGGSAEDPEANHELIEIGLRVPVIPGIKAVLRWTGIDCGQCLAPRRWLTPEEETGLRNALRASSLAHLAG